MSDASAAVIKPIDPVRTDAMAVVSPRGRPIPSSLTKPRLLLFQFKYGPDVPSFMVRHAQEHVKCLQNWFDVQLINYDCDFGVACDRHEPDLVMFETGVTLRGCQRLKIANLNRNARVPRVALLNADGWSEARSGILSDLHEWDLSAAFAIAATAREHLRCLDGRLFFWLNSIDPDVFRNYGDEKALDAVMIGSQDGQYPWRHAVYRELQAHFDTQTYRHGGYESRESTAAMPVGEQYARAIALARFAPACGTVAKELVRKHLEIPGCGTCLIAEESPILREAGFVGMANCVFADEHDVRDVVTYLLKHRDKLDEITRAGHELVHRQHTAKDRGQIAEWFRLHQTLGPGERIVQRGPFQLPVKVSSFSRESSIYLETGGRQLQLIANADRLVARRAYAEAEEHLTKCERYMPMLLEVQLKLAQCSLYRGRALDAVGRLVSMIRYTLVSYRAASPDPVEWAYLIVGLLCLGKLSQAALRARQFPELSHPELDRARFAVQTIAGSAAIGGTRGATGGPHLSVHDTTPRSSAEWCSDVATMLRACGRETWAAALVASEASAGEERKPSHIGILQRLVTSSWMPHLGLVQGRRPTLYRLDNPILMSVLRRRVLRGRAALAKVRLSAA